MIQRIPPIGPIVKQLSQFRYSSLFCLLLSTGFIHSDDPVYTQQLAQWHQKRVASLRSESGWLNLAGLFWLKEGDNSVGGDTGNDLAFPSGKVPNRLGTFHLQNGTVQFEPAPEVVVLTNGAGTDARPLLKAETIFSADSRRPVTLQHGSLRWFVIKRGNKYGVRLRDLESPTLTDFHGIDRFPADESWRVKARLAPPPSPRTIPILDVLGLISQQPLAGTLVFERAGQTYKLDAVSEGEKLFILFGDATNAKDTYGSGRFLYADLPGADGSTTLDFNQAINPPCAFTPFATCPLPPKQNKLAVLINAGEKRYGDH